MTDYERYATLRQYDNMRFVTEFHIASYKIES